MIQPLRRVHRYVFTTLAVVLPVLVVAGILMRHEPVEGREGDQVVGTRKSGVPARGHLSIQQMPTGVVLVARDALVYPDLLVYSAKSQASDVLPADAVLLGTFHSGRTYAIENETASVVLYSPAHQAVIDTIAIGGDK